MSDSVEQDEEPTGSTKEQLEEFAEEYRDEFLTLLEVPLVAYSRDNSLIVPYEYSDRVVRYKRTEYELNELIFDKRLFRLLMYCFKNKIDKQYLAKISGGNLLGYHLMRQSYSNRG